MIAAFWRKATRFVTLWRSGDARDRIYLYRRLRQLPFFGSTFMAALRLRARLTQRTPEDYLRMQKATFERYALADRVDPGKIEGDYVVGSWEQHDKWQDYETYLMRYVPRDASWIALDFGCGPGRNIRRWSALFARIDGVDISSRNLENARVFLEGKIPVHKRPNLYLTDGNNCGDAPQGQYDFVFSTICLQHICVHAVRFEILKSLFACLKPAGRLSIQMGYGVPSPSSVGYFDDHVSAHETNRDCDVAISSPDEIEGDLRQIGFVNFEHWIRPVGPGDVHPKWIFFTATKPV